MVAAEPFPSVVVKLSKPRRRGDVSWKLVAIERDRAETVTSPAHRVDPLALEVAQPLLVGQQVACEAPAPIQLSVTPPISTDFM